MIATDLTAPRPRLFTATAAYVITFGLTAGTGTDWASNALTGMKYAIPAAIATWTVLAVAHISIDRNRLQRANRVLRHQQSARDNVIAHLEAENASLRGTRRDQGHLIDHLIAAHRDGTPIHPAIRATTAPKTTRVSA